MTLVRFRAGVSIQRAHPDDATRLTGEEHRKREQRGSHLADLKVLCDSYGGNSSSSSEYDHRRFCTGEGEEAYRDRTRV